MSTGQRPCLDPMHYSCISKLLSLLIFLFIFDHLSYLKYLVNKMNDQI
jgi:hypothetical protein